ncbi:hypothetical protein LFAB_13780 [Lactiplantibacillus fabifermentans T30PCM01]|uniref:Uncharacterized protein n=1 Tax=Lactiplantibacillus fabifermentans T30PCM01 TaxID=1400520 RepID=W6TBT6_9LACO|nr:hypothetical protein LFAB_13780 [Lactiplantibacillus fabifermentans T30PCM01]
MPQLADRNSIVLGPVQALEAVLDLAFEPEKQVSKDVRDVNGPKTPVNTTFRTIPLRSANC